MFECTNASLQPYRCVCGPFETHFLRDLIRHTQENHNPNVEGDFDLKTCVCSLKTYSKYLYLQHTLLNNCAKADPRPYRCQQCNYAATKSSDLSCHIIRKHTDVSKIEWNRCKECPKKYKVDRDLKRHLRYAHPKQPQWLKCEECDYTTVNKRYLMAHILRHVRRKQKKKLKCEHCSFECDIKSALATHNMRRHVDPSQIQWLQCDKCPRKFKLPKDLRQHVNYQHSDIKKYTCEHCGYTFPQQRYLTRHVARKHTKLPEIEWQQCEQCLKKYKTKGDLTRHVKTVHLDKPQKRLQCDQCDYRTPYLRHLKLHISRKHTSTPSKYECQQCDFKTKGKTYLKNHVLRKHATLAQNEWFECEQCPKRYKMKQDLMQHMKNVHTERSQWMQCELCPLVLKTRQLLKKHVKFVHAKSEDMPILECKLCNYKSVHESYIKIHMGRMHKAKKNKKESVKTEDDA